MKELKLKGAQSPLKQEVNIFCSCFPETLCNNVSYPRTGISLGPELMITQPNVLLTEMLFLGSMLTIIIVTNFAWEPVSQDLHL